MRQFACAGVRGFVDRRLGDDSTCRTAPSRHPQGPESGHTAFSFVPPRVRAQPTVTMVLRLSRPPSSDCSAPVKSQLRCATRAIFWKGCSLNRRWNSRMGNETGKAYVKCGSSSMFNGPSCAERCASDVRRPAVIVATLQGPPYSRPLVPRAPALPSLFVAAAVAACMRLVEAAKSATKVCKGVKRAAQVALPASSPKNSQTSFRP